MSFDWMRRTLLALAGATLALGLAGCGSSTIESQFRPARLVVFGDATSDIGQHGGARYTVNDGGLNNWSLYTASQYGLPLSASSVGGTAYAIGSARITAQPDAEGNAATPTVQQQVDAYLATTTPRTNDLVFFGAGTSDLIVEVQKVLAGQQTRDQMLANVATAARGLGAQARRVVAGGATHVVFVPPYDLGKSSWAKQTSQQSLMSDATTKFTTSLLVDIVDQGATMLYVDTPFIVNLLYASPGSYGIVDVDNPACTTIDPGVGIGTGTGQPNSLLCTPATVPTGTTYPSYLFADRVYLTPAANQQVGSYVYSRTVSRW